MKLSSNTLPNMIDEPLSARPMIAASYVAEFFAYRFDGQGESVEGSLCARIGGDDMSLSMTVYRAPVSAEAETGARPVIFFFNGGPGASSTPLHLNGFGPMLHVSSQDEKHLFSDNPDTLLDVADLVFIDPVGTGFNRLPAVDEPSARWLGVDGDAQAAAAAIRAWLEHDGMAGRRVFLCGQSYGAFRVGTILPYLEDLNLAGLILISPMLDASARTAAPGNDLPYVVTLPTMAVAAHYHGVTTHPESVDAMALYAEVSQFARTDYAAALQWGSELERIDAPLALRVATELARLLNISEEDVRQRGWRIDADNFMNTLLSDRQCRIGSLDTRETGSLAAATDKPTNDPSLVVGRTPGRTEDYFRRYANVETSRLYVGLSFEVNRRWQWMPSGGAPCFYTSVVGKVGAFMRARPEAHLLAACGIYDMSTPALSTRYALTHAEVSPKRMHIVDFPAGHTIYDTSDNRTALARAIRKMVLT